MNTNETSAIEISGLSKDFSTDFWKPKVHALKNITFSVRPSTVFGLIGPNGAGKTTTIKAILGLIRPTVGTIQIFGSSTDEKESKHYTGYLPENAYYYDYLKAWEIIDFYGRLFGLSKKEREKRIDSLLELVDLKDKRDVRLRGFSKGMLQRIGIAQALVNDPKLVILDEPMSGLDPIGRKEVRDIILRLAEQKKTILFSSHILSDVEAICEDVAIIVQGKLRAFGALHELVKPQVKSSEVTFISESSPALPNEWSDFVKSRTGGGQLVLTVSDPSRLLQVIDWGKNNHLHLLSVVPQKESLEALFMEKVESDA